MSQAGFDRNAAAPREGKAVVGANGCAWTCRCGWANRGMNNKCGGGNAGYGCGRERPEKGVGGVGAPERPRTAVGVATRGGWQCACGWRNRSSNRVCGGHKGGDGRYGCGQPQERGESEEPEDQGRKQSRKPTSSDPCGQDDARVGGTDRERAEVSPIQTMHELHPTQEGGAGVPQQQQQHHQNFHHQQEVPVIGDGEYGYAPAAEQYYDQHYEQYYDQRYDQRQTYPPTRMRTGGGPGTDNHSIHAAVHHLLQEGTLVVAADTFSMSGSSSPLDYGRRNGGHDHYGRESGHGNGGGVGGVGVADHGRFAPGLSQESGPNRRSLSSPDIRNDGGGGGHVGGVGSVGGVGGERGTGGRGWSGWWEEGGEGEC